MDDTGSREGRPESDPGRVQRELQDFLARARRRWRIRVGVRGLLSGLALGAVATLALLGAEGFGVLTPSLRPSARWLVLGAIFLPLAAALLRGWIRPPADHALALRMEETCPEVRHVPSVFLELSPHHPFAPELARDLGSNLDANPPSRLVGRWVGGREAMGAAFVVVLASLTVLWLGGPATLWSHWGEGDPTWTLADSEGPPVLLQSAEQAVDPLRDLTIRVIPPAYTGLDPWQPPPGEPVSALVGSRMEVTPGVGGGPSLEFRVLRADREAAPLPPAEGSVSWILDPGDRGLVVAAEREGQVRERVIPLQPFPDEPPQVELLEPTSDMVLARGSGEVTFRARASDVFGIESFELSWVHSRGSGESFDFREGAREWSRLERTEEGIVGTLTLRLDDLDLGPGEVLHLRAVARDVNSATGPGTGVSRTRQIRVIREGQEMEVDALLGLPLEVDQEPVLSQRMILLMTEDLLARAPTLERQEFSRESERIAREQARLRGQVAEQVFSRATGAMEPVDRHLGDAIHSHDEPGHRRAGEHLDHPPPDEDTEGHDHAHPTGDGDAPSPPRRGSAYGVAAIFDPSAPDEAVSPARPPMERDLLSPAEAGTDVGSFIVGGPGRMPTGFGVLPELGHDHDGDPILSVNRPLLEIHNAMWESERWLRQLDPGTAVPHQEEALEGLQALRENVRVFPRGRVTVPPVDVAGARGTGEVDDADPARRSEGAPRPSSRRWVGELESLLADPGSYDDRRLTALAAALLSDAAVPPEVGALVARAADRVSGEPGRDGDAEVERLLRESLQVLDPAPARTAQSPGLRTSASPFAAAMSGAMSPPSGVSETGVPPATELSVATRPGEATPFVFATLRYESGNWDSAPLVPQNLIHALAQYTELPVEPEGIVVDLSSREIFRYPVLYLTGHLPVRFSDAEARNLERYVERGGFVFMDDHNHDVDGAFHRTATAELARIFGDDALEPLPNDHELYGAFFHFEDGPPTTGHELSGWGDGLIHPELYAILVDGRIGILYSNKDYSSEWSYHYVNKRFLAVDNTRFGVNLIIYALTR